MKEISFLIGSGFSIPEGIPPTTKINRTISNIKADDFYFGTDESAGFLKGVNYPNNKFEHLEERKFVEKFIKYYNRQIIGNKNKFNYEDFYDYFIDIYEGNNINKDIEHFLIDFEILFQVFVF